MHKPTLSPSGANLEEAGAAPLRIWRYYGRSGGWLKSGMHSRVERMKQRILTRLSSRMKGQASSLRMVKASDIAEKDSFI
jgi:hypothetical protein